MIDIETRGVWCLFLGKIPNGGLAFKLEFGGIQHTPR